MTDILVAIGALIVALGAAYGFGRSGAKTAQKLDRLRKEDAAHDRINEADLGIGAADDANTQWMREFATKHGKR